MKFCLSRTRTTDGPLASQIGLLGAIVRTIRVSLAVARTCKLGVVSTAHAAATVVSGAYQADFVEEISKSVIIEFIATDKGVEAGKPILGIVGTGIVGCAAPIQKYAKAIAIGGCVFNLAGEAHESGAHVSA